MSALGSTISPFANVAGSGFASSFGSGLAGAIFGGIQARRQWKYQQKSMALQQEYALAQMAKSAEYQLQHDKAMFDYQNEYNDPSKVFERYMKAGINPAAVLGSSGVGVSATVPTGSGGAPSGSTPSGSGGSIGSNVPLSSDPTAIAQNMMASSTTNRNNAAARLDNAEAANLENRTQSKDYYATLAELDRQLLSHRVNDARTLVDYHSALASIEEVNASYADLNAVYNLDLLIANVGITTEAYSRARSLNDAEIPLFDQVVAANLAYTYAQIDNLNANTSLANANTDLAKVSVSDLQNWFAINWDTPIDVPQVTESGKPTGKFIKMTGREIKQYLIGLDVSQGAQGLQKTWFETRNEKNAFRNQLINTVVHGATLAGAAYLTGGKAAALSSATSTATGSSNGTESTMHERYDARGNYVGGTRVTRNWMNTSDQNSHSTRRNRR